VKRERVKKAENKCKECPNGKVQHFPTTSDVEERAICFGALIDLNQSKFGCSK
jgi:hypothetical protein